MIYNKREDTVIIYYNIFQTDDNDFAVKLFENIQKKLQL